MYKKIQVIETHCERVHNAIKQRGRIKPKRLAVIVRRLKSTSGSVADSAVLSELTAGANNGKVCWCYRGSVRLHVHTLASDYRRD